jgi:CRISPR-associated protein Cas2
MTHCFIGPFFGQYMPKSIQLPRLGAAQERVLLVYDVSDERRLRRVAKVCEAYGQRVQRSVFELHLQPGQLLELQARLRELVSPGEDKVRYYRLCGADASDIAVDGQGHATEPHRFTVV